MNRETGARTSDAIPDSNIGGVFSHLDHSPSTAISQSRWLIEAAPHGGNGSEDTVSTNFAHYVPHQIRTRLRFLKQILRRKLRRCALRACRNQRRSHSDQHTSLGGTRRRDVSHFDFPVAGVLQYLLHAIAACMDSSEKSAAPSRKLCVHNS